MFDEERPQVGAVREPPSSTSPAGRVVRRRQPTSPIFSAAPAVEFARVRSEVASSAIDSAMRALGFAVFAPEIATIAEGIATVWI